MRKPDIDSEEFQIWLDHPITERVMQRIAEEIKVLESKWTRVLYTGSEDLELLRTGILHRQEALDWVLKTTEEDINEEKEDSEHVGNSPA